MMNIDELENRLIELAFAEDIGDGDHTTLCCIPEDATGSSHLLIKEDGILAGVEVAKNVFAAFDPTLKVEVRIPDGSPIKVGDIAIVVTGKTRSLLQTERLMLNIMQRMSGIATMTRQYVERLKGTHTRILDTRKTTPGLRMLEKQAVKIGGGTNHRIGLFDMSFITSSTPTLYLSTSIAAGPSFCATLSLSRSLSYLFFASFIPISSPKSLIS